MCARDFALFDRLQCSIAVFLKKKGQQGQAAQQEMRDKLGGFVKRVEEHLYATARSRVSVGLTVAGPVHVPFALVLNKCAV